MIDLCALDVPERERRVQSQIDNEFVHVFDLSHGPLMTLKLLKVGEDEHVLVKNIHHIISDSWSEEVFLREWISLYESFSQNRQTCWLESRCPIQHMPISVNGQSDSTCRARSWRSRSLIGKRNWVGEYRRFHCPRIIRGP